MLTNHEIGTRVGIVLKTCSEMNVTISDAVDILAAAYITMIAGQSSSQEEARTIIRNFTQKALVKIGPLWVLNDKLQNPDKYKTEETPNKNRSIYLD